MNFEQKCSFNQKCQAHLQWIYPWYHQIAIRTAMKPRKHIPERQKMWSQAGSLHKAVRNRQKASGTTLPLQRIPNASLGLKPPYVTRVLGLNNLAPDIVEAIVNGAEPNGLSIAQIMKNIPEDWNEQRRLFGFPERWWREPLGGRRNPTAFFVSRVVFDCKNGIL